MEVIDLSKQKKIKEMDRLSRWTVHFGKYKNGTFKELADDRQYSIWLLKQNEFINKNQELKKYMEYTLTQPN